MTAVSTNRRTFSKRPLVVLLMVVLVPAAVASTVFAAADIGDPLHQVLTIVQSIQAALTGTGGSLSALQSDVTAIKTKTDNLPEDTNAKLVALQQSVDDIKAGTGGLGPLNRFSTRTLFVAPGQSDSATCTSTGPYLLHVTAQGSDASVIAALNGSSILGEYLPSSKTSSVVLGGNASDAITIQGSTSPSGSLSILMMMQTTEGAIVGCN